jgi:hypothetical protein
LLWIKTLFGGGPPLSTTTLPDRFIMLGSVLSVLEFEDGEDMKMSPVVFTGGSPPLLDCASRLVFTVTIRAMQQTFQCVTGILPPVCQTRAIAQAEKLDCEEPLTDYGDFA